jgi:8-oxo-dGTP diphosphatase
LALVHRPRYDDWSLPKGKLDSGESFEAAALREVMEETGVTCELGPELRSSRYTDLKGRSKHVRWWLMTPQEPAHPLGEFVPGDEVDELRWCDEEEAVALVDYPADASLIREALNLYAASSGDSAR